MRTASASSGLMLVLVLAAFAMRSARTHAEDPLAPRAGLRSCVITGQVVDAYEEGVGGVGVAWIPDAPAGDPSIGASVRTDATGRFLLAVEGPDDQDVRGTIHVTQGDDAAVIEAVRVRVGHGAYDAGPLRLTSARPLDVDVRRDGLAVADAVVWLWTWTGNLYWGQPAHLGTAKTNQAGVASFRAVPHAYYKLLAQAPDGSAGEATRQVVPGYAASRMRLDVAPTRSVRVRVVDDADPAMPLAGADVTRELAFALEDVLHRVAVDLPGRIPPTGDDGYVGVDGLPPDRVVELRARVPGRPLGRATCGPGATEATIVVPGPTRIAVVEGERPAPPDGTRLLVWPRRSAVPQVEGWMEDGQLAVPFTERQVGPGVVVAPDGSIAPLDRAAPTSFFRPRSLDVRIVEEGGGAVETQVSLSPVPYMQGPWAGPFSMDAQGRARIQALPPGKHRVYAFPTSRRIHGVLVGEVDLTQGDVTQDIVVGRERILRLRMSVDDVAEIPAAPWWDLTSAFEMDAKIDRAAGEIRLRARPQAEPPPTGSIRVGGRGVRSRDLTFTWPAGGATVEIDASLRRAPEIVAEVRADLDFEVDVYLEKWCAWNTGNAWLAAHDVYPHLRGRTRLHLEPGRYRMHDKSTGVVSEPFDVPEHGGRVHPVLDVTGLVAIRGRIECPVAPDCGDLEIGVEGEGIDAQFDFTMPFSRRRGLPCEGGAFVVHVPAGRPVTLRPWHRTFQPAREGGEVTLVGPQDDVVLRMGHGATVRVTLTGPDGDALPSEALQRSRIAAASSAFPLRPAVVAHAMPVEGSPGTVSATGLPFGTLDLWVVADVDAEDGYAACKWSRAQIDVDVVDLGACRLTQGSRVAIRRVDGDRGKIVPDPWRCWAMGMFGLGQQIRLRRSAYGSDAIGQFEGLSAGRWHITLEGMRSTPSGDVEVRRRFEIEVDGEQHQTLDVDFSE